MIDKSLLKEITSYCSANQLDLDKFINDLLKQAFMIKKYPPPNTVASEDVIKPQIDREVKNKEIKKNIYGE